MLKTTIALALVLCGQAVFAESINSIDPTPVQQPVPVFSGTTTETPSSYSAADKARLEELTDEYYSAKRGAIIFNVIGTGVGLVGEVLVNTACEDKTKTSGSGYYSYSYTETDCDGEQMLAGVGLVVAAIPFEVVGVIKIVQSFVRGNQLRREEERQGVSPVAVVPTYNPRNKALGMLAVGSF